MAPSNKRRSCNPFAFQRWPVTIIATVVYIAILIPVLVVDVVVPSAPETVPHGLDLHQAWADLQTLTEGFHPYNSHQNDKVHSWILKRVNSIVSENQAPPKNVPTPFDDTQALSQPDVFIFDDAQSNLTFRGPTGLGVYFEGTNILVYIRGSEDDQTNWWEVPHAGPSGRGGVLVNSHYDSVSTGYGATDDGVGVVTCLQLVKYFTTPGHQPRKGLVVLFNNGEEDYLNGARAYSQHPISRFPHTFVNVEGAGAGGRATLFRGSDTEVVRFYEQVEHPFGSVLSQDGFKAGVIRSQTDYVVLEGVLGLRGLDIAFMRPRARYHTDQDDAKHTSIDSVWHMLSAVVATTEGLVSDTSDQFDGRTDGQGKIPSGSGTEAVWFDLFGDTFVVFRLHVLFALQVTLLVVSPLLLFLTSITLTNSDRMYLFSLSAMADHGEEKASIKGLRGLFRFPFLFICPTGACVALAFLLEKVNPLIIHSSQYVVWSMFISIWFFITWFLSRIANFARPTALHRAYTLTWMFTLMWALLVVATVFENRDGIAGGYFIFFYALGVFLATWISYLEMFALPRKTDYANQCADHSRRGSSSRLLTPSTDEIRHSSAHGDEEPSESTSLLRGGRTTFANYTTVETDDGDESEEQADGASDMGRDYRVYGYEQPWSASLPKWTWIVQLLLIAPCAIILVGQIALLIVGGVYQTGQDGSPMLPIYLEMAALTTLLLMPLIPFIHRYTYHVPTFLILVFIVTLIYNLTAFPFSEGNRVKLYFQQEVDLDTGKNLVSLTGIPPYVRDTIDYLPSAANQNPACHWVSDRYRCSWEGLDPQVAKAKPTTTTTTSPSSSSSPSSRLTKMKDWVSYNATRLDNDKPNKSKAHARFHISGLNTRACVLRFDKPISSFQIAGAATDPRFPTNPTSDNEEEIREIRLWSRTWENTWIVDVDWTESDNETRFGERQPNPNSEAALSNKDQDNGHLTGHVVCLWSDRNTKGLIPALDEALLYLPAWVAVTKYADGLVEGSKAFKI